MFSQNASQTPKLPKRGFRGFCLVTTLNHVAFKGVFQPRYGSSTAKQALYCTEVFGHRLYLGPFRQHLSRWWQVSKIFGNFHPETWGRQIPNLTSIFFKGWLKPPTRLFFLCVIFVDGTPMPSVDLSGKDVYALLTGDLTDNWRASLDARCRDIAAQPPASLSTEELELQLATLSQEEPTDDVVVRAAKVKAQIDAVEAKRAPNSQLCTFAGAVSTGSVKTRDVIRPLTKRTLDSPKILLWLRRLKKQEDPIIYFRWSSLRGFVAALPEENCGLCMKPSARHIHQPWCRGLKTLEARSLPLLRWMSSEMTGASQNFLEFSPQIIWGRKIPNLTSIFFKRGWETTTNPIFFCVILVGEIRDTMRFITLNILPFEGGTFFSCSRKTPRSNFIKIYQGYNQRLKGFVHQFWGCNWCKEFL